MSRRLYSSVPINKLHCSDCKLYNPTTQICKMNNVNAFQNRLDDKNCGLNGKNFWALDKTNLIQSERYYKYSGYFGLFAITSVPCGILIDYKFFLWSFISFYFADILSDMSEKSKHNFFHDNNITK